MSDALKKVIDSHDRGALTYSPNDPNRKEVGRFMDSNGISSMSTSGDNGRVYEINRVPENLGDVSVRRSR
jgi:hypothetical protein